MNPSLSIDEIRKLATAARKRQDLTQGTIGRRAGLHQNTISDLETGRMKYPNNDILMKWCAAVDIKLVISMTIGPPEDMTKCPACSYALYE